MRIAIINSIRAYGGGEKWVLRTAAGLMRREVSVTVIAARESELSQHCKESGVPFEPVELRHEFSPPTLFGVARALRASAPDVAICCNERAVRVAALAARLVAVRPTLVYRCGLEGSFKNNWRNRLLAGPVLDRYVTNAEATRQELLGFDWIPPQRVSVIYNGVDSRPGPVMDTTALRRTLGAGQSDVVVLTAARLVPEKGHALLLEALAPLLRERPEVRVWIAGAGPEEAALRSQIAHSGLSERVALLGFRDDVPALLRAADVLCHPSRREGAPNVVLEAMVAGLPVVGVAAAGTAELVQSGRTGLLSDIGDVEALRKNLQSVVSDAGLRARFGTAGREHALAEFTEERSLGRWMDLLTECAQARRGARN